jgi:hypothetical protein
MRMGFRSSSRTRFRSSRRTEATREDGGDAARVGWRGRIWLRALREVVERRGGGGQGRREEESAYNLTLYDPTATSARWGGVNPRGVGARGGGEGWQWRMGRQGMAER